MYHGQNFLQSSSQFLHNSNNRYSPKTILNFHKCNTSGKLPIFMDSCQIIEKSREEILGLSSPKKLKERSTIKHINTEVKSSLMKIQRNYSCRKNPKNDITSFHKLKRKPEYFICEEKKTEASLFKKKEDQKKDIYADNNDRLTAEDISKDVVYSRGGVGFQNAKFKVTEKPIINCKIGRAHV